MSILINRYKPRHKKLKRWVKYIWFFEIENANIHQEILPTDCIDIIINLGTNIVYENKHEKIIAPTIHINGLRKENSTIHQVGYVKNIGISFYSYGLYPFVNDSLRLIRDNIVDLDELSSSLTFKLRSIVIDDNLEVIVNSIEQALLSELMINNIFLEKISLIEDYMNMENNMIVKEYCIENNVTIKTFERLVKRYTGYSPKLLKSLQRFQTISNELVHQDSSTITAITYDNDFADQAHFNREFSRFSGHSPKSFKDNKTSIKQNVKYKYK